jgi:hypothetical protein
MMPRDAQTIRLVVAHLQLPAVSVSRGGRWLCRESVTRAPLHSVASTGHSALSREPSQPVGWDWQQLLLLLGFPDQETYIIRRFMLA